MKIFSLIETQYNQYVLAVKKYLSNLLSKSGDIYGNNTIFGQMINVLSNTVQNMMLYIEDALVEQNKYTAQRKKSIYGLAALSGYNPSLGKATGVQLKIDYIPTNLSQLNVVINNHEKLTCTQNGLNYYIVLPQEALVMSIEKDNSTKYVYAVQGRFETQSFISTGGKYYTKNIRFTGNLDIDYLTLKVNDELWEKRDSFYDMDPNGLQYVIKTSPIGGIDIVFGNDRFGKSLQKDDVISVEYLLHDGELGNLNSLEETYFVFDNLLKNIAGDEVDGNHLFNVTFATNDPISSGSNSESIDQVRQMIGLNSRSFVLASPDNYKEFLTKFSFCGYNRTWSEPGSLVVNSLVVKNYQMLLAEGKDYFDLSEKDFYLSELQKNSIKNCIENSGNQLAGVSYNIFDPQICKYSIYIYVTLKSEKYEKDYVKSNIRKLVGEFFGQINSDLFIPKSDIIHLIKENIKEIDGVDVYFLSELNETAIQKQQYDSIEYKYDPSTGIYRKNIKTVYLYPGENPNLGLDEHGNIYLPSDEQFPVLMGGWDYINSEGQEVNAEPIIITFK